MWSLRACSLAIVKVFFAHESITNGDEVKCYSHVAACEVSKLLGISLSTCSRIRKECVPHVEPSRGWHPRSITPTQWQGYVRAITVGGIDSVVNVRKSLSEHQHMRRALHEASLGPLEKHKNSKLKAKFCPKFPHVEPSRGWRPRSITPTQWPGYVRAITVGGIDSVVNVRKSLSEHQHMRRALHDASLGPLEKHKIS